MVLEMKERIICCIIAAILFFLGIGMEPSVSNSSILRANESETIRSVEHIVNEAEVCPPSMLTNGATSIQRSLSIVGSRWQDRTLPIILFVGVCLQYLLCYQSEQCREDGQLFLCRSMVVDYIHLKDSGE